LEVSVRPLRASTVQGERSALARSEVVPEGARIEFHILTFGGVAEADLREWLTFGMVQGMGSWRNAGYGTFFFELEEIFDNEKEDVVRGIADAGKLLGFAKQH